MADAVQNRARRPGIAVVLRSQEGTGNGGFCSQFGSLFGSHFIQVSQASHLTGNFNSHLKDKLIVYADEAFWAGDKKAEGGTEGDDHGGHDSDRDEGKGCHHV